MKNELRRIIFVVGLLSLSSSVFASMHNEIEVDISDREGTIVDFSRPYSTFRSTEIATIDSFDLTKVKDSLTTLATIQIFDGVDEFTGLRKDVKQVALHLLKEKNGFTMFTTSGGGPFSPLIVPKNSEILTYCSLPVETIVNKRSTSSFTLEMSYYVKQFQFDDSLHAKPSSFILKSDNGDYHLIECRSVGGRINNDPTQNS